MQPETADRITSGVWSNLEKVCSPLPRTVAVITPLGKHAVTVGDGNARGGWVKGVQDIQE